MPEPRITVYSKPGCHLCDSAKEVVARVAADTGAGWVDVDINSDPELVDEYAEMIPVIMLDGRMHGYFRVEEERLRRDIAHGNRLPGAVK
jgi:glutaredoxin